MITVLEYILMVWNDFYVMDQELNRKDWMWESVNPFAATILFVTEDGTIQTPTLLKGRTVLVEYTYERK